MDTQEVIKEIKELKETVRNKNKISYDFDLLERIIIRLETFSECTECKSFLDEFPSIIEEINKNPLIKSNKEYDIFLKSVTEHLLKKHKLVTKNYYTNMYMTYGISFGLLFGVIFSQSLGQTSYIGLGLPIGIAIGLSIGNQLDAKAKKDNLLI